MLTEIVWFVFIVYILFLVLSLKVKNTMLRGTAGMFGLIAGLSIAQNVHGLVGIIMIFFNLYILYLVIVKIPQKGA